MNKIKLLVLLIIIFSTGRISAQKKAVEPMEVSITSQMQMRMNENSTATFDIPANSKNGTIEELGALHIDVQTNRDWVLHVKPVPVNLTDPSSTESIPSESLRIRADGKSFISLDKKGINLIKGNKGSYKSAGHSLSVDYELTLKNDQKPHTYRIDLLYTLVAI